MCSEKVRMRLGGVREKIRTERSSEQDAMYEEQEDQERSFIPAVWEEKVCRREPVPEENTLRRESEEETAR